MRKKEEGSVFVSEEIKRLQHYIDVRNKKIQELKEEVALYETATDELIAVCNAFAAYFCQEKGGVFEIPKEDIKKLMENSDYRFENTQKSYKIVEVKKNGRKQRRKKEKG